MIAFDLSVAIPFRRTESGGKSATIATQTNDANPKRNLNHTISSK
jgi:hypothetical protein